MTDLPSRFFHGSMRAFEPGFTLTPRGADYESAWTVSGFYGPLERGRPEGCLPQRDAVFLCGSVDDVELSGGGTEWCMEVEPTGPVTRHDVNWANEVAALLDGGADPDSEAVLSAVASYWSGVPHPDETVWEYLATAARVMRCEPFDDLDPEGAPSGPGV